MRGNLALFFIPVKTLTKECNYPSTLQYLKGEAVLKQEGVMRMYDWREPSVKNITICK